MKHSVMSSSGIPNTLVVGTLLVAVAFGGCGGDSDSGGSSGSNSATTVNSGVPDNKSLEDVSEEEARDICESFADQFAGLATNAKVVSGACTIDAVVAAAISGEEVDADECAEVRDTCIQDGSASLLEDEDGAFSDGPDCTEDDVADDISTCDASVAELEQCLSGIVGVFVDAFDGITCDAFASGATDLDSIERNGVVAENPFETPPAVCDDLFARCPDLFEGETTEESSSGSGGE